VNVERLVRQLGSPAYAEREAASQALLKMGESALEALRQARASTDPEVCRRAALLTEAIEARLCRELRRMGGHLHPVQCVAFSPDGRRALSAGKSIVLWDVASGRPLRRLKGHDSPRHLAFSPEGRRAASSDGFEAVLWDLDAAREARRLRLPLTGLYFSPGLAFLPDGNRLVAGGRLFDARTGQETLGFGDVRSPSVAVSPDGRLALLGNQPDFFPCGLGVTREDLERYRRSMFVQLCDARTGEALRRLEGHECQVTQVAFGPDGRRACSASLEDRSVRVWDLTQGKQLRCLDVPAAGCVAFSPDCRRVLIGGEDGAVVLWDLASGKELRRYYGHQGRVSCVAFSPDGRLALSGGQDHTLRLWRLLPK
jgi:WD40 repeat protein